MKNVSLNDDTLEMPSDITLLVLGVNKTYFNHHIIGMSILHAWYDLDPKIEFYLFQWLDPRNIFRSYKYF